MAYATVDQLAAALHISVTVKNTDDLQRCVDAAAEQIDHDLDRLVDDPLPVPAPAIVVSINIAYAVEVFKANDAAFGGVGFADTGILTVPNDGFARHSAALVPYRQQFGIA